MKKETLIKVISLLSALVFIFCMTGCGETGSDAQDEPEPITSIEIGGDYDAIELSGKAVGEYTKVDIPEWFTVVEGDADEMYCCEDCDTPYIAVVNHPVDTESFEAAVKEYCDTWGNGYYQMMDENSAYMTGSSTLEDGTVYYEASLIYSFEDSIKVVIFFGKTEEVQLADSGLYFNILTGYENKLNESSEEFGASVYAEYDKSYYFPNVYACVAPESYEKEKLYYDFLKEFNMTEEQYNEWSKDWNDENTTAYLDSLGFEVLYKTTVTREEFDVYAYCCKTDNTTSAGASYDNFIWVIRNGKAYLINTYSDLDDPTAAYLSPILDSIKVK